MEHTEEISYSCPIAAAVDRIGDAWSLLILRDASRGSTRFDQFRQSLGIAPNILTRRLVALVESGLFEKHRYSVRPPRDEYRLTAAARDFMPILIALGAWGGRYFDDGQMAKLVDATTGKAFDPVVVDRDTGLPLMSVAASPKSSVATSLEAADGLRLGGFDSNVVDARTLRAVPAARGEGIE